MDLAQLLALEMRDGAVDRAHLLAGEGLLAAGAGALMLMWAR